MPKCFNPILADDNNNSAMVYGKIVQAVRHTKLGDKEKSKSLFPWISFNRLYNLKIEEEKKKKPVENHIFQTWRSYLYGLIL